MRSVSVVLPASMCAAMPMVRVFSSRNLGVGELGFVVAFGLPRVAVAIFLPAEMCKGAVRLRHLVSVVALLDRVALTRRRVLQFSRERVRHRHTAAVIGKGHNPAHRER